MNGRGDTQIHAQKALNFCAERREMVREVKVNDYQQVRKGDLLVQLDDDFLVNYFGQPEIAGLSAKTAAVYVSFYWAGAIDMITLNQGEPVANGPIAIIAPGTGLGESFLT
jgi:hypothetical protein